MGTSLLTYPGSLNIIELGEGPKDKCTNTLENCTLPNVNSGDAAQHRNQKCGKSTG